jgi:hypothetical protein
MMINYTTTKTPKHKNTQKQKHPKHKNPKTLKHTKTPTTHPIITVGVPATMLPPCAVGSPMRAAGLPPIRTVVEPMMMLSGGPVQIQVSPTTAAGIPPISTVGAPGPIIGPPTCGTGPGLTKGHTCISVILAAGGMVIMTND